MLSCLFIAALWSPAGKGLTSWLLLVMFNYVFVTFPCGILGHVWYLIVSIPDLCRLSLFHCWAMKLPKSCVLANIAEKRIFRSTYHKIFLMLLKRTISISSFDYNARIQRGDRGSRPSLKNHINVGFLSNTGPDPLKTKPAFNVWPLSARQRNAIPMAFCLWADDGPLLVVL